MSREATIEKALEELRARAHRKMINYSDADTRRVLEQFRASVLEEAVRAAGAVYKRYMRTAAGHGANECVQAIRALAQNAPEGTSD